MHSRTEETMAGKRSLCLIEEQVIAQEVSEMVYLS